MGGLASKGKAEGAGFSCLQLLVCKPACWEKGDVLVLPASEVTEVLRVVFRIRLRKGLPLNEHREEMSHVGEWPGRIHSLSPPVKDY